MLVENILDGAQSFLHDNSGRVWTRAELLRLLNDGYRQFIAEALPTVRIYQLDVPARDTGAGSQEWEDQQVSGNFSHFTIPAQSLVYQCTYSWEAELLAGSIPTEPQNGYDCVTHDWERSYVENNVDNHFRFVLAKTHERPRYAFWGDKALGSRAVTELDLRDQRWWVEGGQPIVYLGGNGRELSFEIFEVETEYRQAYYLIAFEQGAPRQFTSDAARTYEVLSPVDAWAYAYSSGEDYLSITGLGYKFTTFDEANSRHNTFSWEADITEDTDGDSAYVVTQPWEIEFTAQDAILLGIGSTRGLSSGDRQYLPMAYDSGLQHYGIARDFHSSDESISIFEHTVPTRPLDENDIPDLIPSQLHKFLKYYIIGMALARPGEGYRPDLAQHWLALYKLGVDFLASLATPSFVDSALARGQVNEVRATTPPRVRLPSTYPSVRRGR